MAKMTITSFMTGIKNWVLAKQQLITALIPSQATAQNQLADKAYVNSSISTATATFCGTYNCVSDLSLAYNATHAQIAAALGTAVSTADNNDYAFVQVPTSTSTPTEIAKTEKYKFNGSIWGFEYELNSSGFTSDQWAAINSGATLELIGKLRDLPTNAELINLLNAKQDTINDLADIRSGATAGSTAVQPSALAAALVQTVAEAGVFDVTANNDGATFDDLEDLLSDEDLATLIPEAVRAGGMAIKFVTTSDNKYVQYRLMAQNFTTDTTQWQGVDDTTLNNNSNNLITNKFVTKEFDKVKGSFNSNDEDTFNVSDAEGNVGMKYDVDGLDAARLSEHFNKETAKNQKLITGFDYDKNDGFYICDEAGNVIFSANSRGINYIGKNESSGSKKVDDGYKQSDIVYNMYYGRSLSYHGQCTPQDDRYTTLAFKLSSYGNPESMLLNVTSDIVDNQAAMDALFLGFRKAPASKNIIVANRALCMFLNQENGIDLGWKDEETLNPEYQFQFVGCNPGEVATYSQLADSNGLYYKRLLKSVEYAKKFADEMGKTFSVGCVCFAHGEDTEANTPKTWYDCVWVLASKLNHDIKAITGQTDDIYLLNYQLGYTDSYDHYSNHALATLALSLCDDPAPEEYTLDVIAAAQLPSGYSLIDRKQIQIGPIMCALSYAHENDHIHASSKSYQAMAAQFGLQMKRCMYDKTPIKPIHVLSHDVRAWNDGKYIITLHMYAPVKPLVLDTTGGEVYSPRADSPYYGFELKNGSDQNIIESVELLRGEDVKIITTENPTGLTLWYAHDGWETGGNLRDSQPVTYSDYTIGEYNVYNWCPKFRMTI